MRRNLCIPASCCEENRRVLAELRVLGAAGIAACVLGRSMVSYITICVYCTLGKTHKILIQKVELVVSPMDDGSIFMIVALVILVCMSAFFSSAETAYSSLNLIRLR